MLTHRHLATLRAALWYWQEEMTGHSQDVAMFYIEDANVLPLEAVECDQLRRRLRNVRYLAYDPRTDTLPSTELFLTSRERELLKRRNDIATLILPSEIV